jgi:hypothetical protein
MNVVGQGGFYKRKSAGGGLLLLVLSCQQRLLGQQCAAESDESTLGWNTLDVTELTVLMKKI